jgi:pimeloyl-ACP methyl ester carboxylesterase
MLVWDSGWVNMNLHFFDWSQRAPSSLPTLIFLHGMGGTGSIWRPIAASLEDQIRCIAPDQRGHGKSRPLTSEQLRHMSALDYGQDVLDLLESLHPHQGLQDFILVGHSMGARTALAVGHLLSRRASHPLRSKIRGTVCVDIGLQGSWGGGMGRPLAQFLETLPSEFASRADLKEWVTGRCPDPSIAQYLIAVSKNLADSNAEKWGFPFDQEAVLQTIAQAQPEPNLVGTRPQTQTLSPLADWALDLNDLQIPVTFLRGETSRVWSSSDYQNQKTLLESPLFHFEEWSQCGHGLPFEQRARFVEWLKKLVQLA